MDRFLLLAAIAACTRVCVRAAATQVRGRHADALPPSADAASADPELAANRNRNVSAVATPVAEPLATLLHRRRRGHSHQFPPKDGWPAHNGRVWSQGKSLKPLPTP